MRETTPSSRHVLIQALERRLLMCAQLHEPEEPTWHAAGDEQFPAAPGGPPLAPAFGFAGAFRAGSGDGETGSAVEVDPTGNLFLAGSFSGAFDVSPGSGVPPLTSAGDTDAFVVRYSPQGSLLWSVAIGGAATDGADSIAIDGNGDLYVTGSFSGAATIRAGQALPVTLTSAGASDAFLVKLNGADGTVRWARQIGGAGSDGGGGVALDGSGASYLASHGPSGTSGSDPTVAFVSKFDADGAIIWTRQRGDAASSPTVPTDIAFDPAGAIVVAGWSHETAPRPSFAWKLSPVDGTTQWDRQWSGNTTGSYNRAHAVAVDGAGNILITGHFSGIVDFNPSPGAELRLTSRTCRDRPGGMITCTNGYSSDIYVLKLQSNGAFAWAAAMGGGARGDDIAYDIATDAGGNAYTTGYFHDKVDFDPGSGRFEITAKGVSSGDWLTDERGVSDVFVSKLDSAGRFAWAAAVGGSNAVATGDGGYGIAVGDDHDVHSTGFFRGAGDFDPTAGTRTLISAGSSDVFVLELTQPAAGASTAATGAFSLVPWSTDPDDDEWETLVE
jgi:hypothetical protein